MKYTITEAQYGVLLREDRVDYLRNQFVIDPKLLDRATDGENDEEEFEDGDRPAGGMRPSKEKVEPIQGHDGLDIAYIVTNKKGKTKVVLTDEIFTDIVDADPTRKKEFVQWMITVFMRHLKEGDIEQAIRFITEDLPEANEFLTVFDRVRKKKSFKRDAANRPNAPENVADITQYNDLGQLFDVVSPFMGDDSEENALWNKLKKHIDLGTAKLAYRDNDVLVYMPQTLEASCEPLGGGMASWCTANRNALNSNHDSSYFAKYRRDYKKPDGSLSDYYVVMPKTLFDGDNEDIYPLQFHFESGQLHNRSNRSIEKSELPKILSKYGGLTEFFKKELGALATIDIRNGSGLMDSKYLTYLTKFGGNIKDVIDDDVWDAGVESIRRLASEQKGALQSNKYLKWLMENTEGVIITDFLNADVETLDFSGIQMSELPDLSRFKNVTRITAEGCGLTKMPPREQLGEEVEIMTFQNNNIKEVPPKGYGTLSNLFVMNLINNPITKFNVDVLEELTSVGSLARFVYSNNDINLTPENQEAFDRFVSDPEGRGYLIQGN